MELFWRFAGNRAAITRGNGIDKDQISYVKQRIFIVDQLVWRRQQRPRIAHLHAPRTKRSKVQPDGSGTGSAIERERHRTLGGVTYIVLGVRNVKHAGLWCAVLEFQQNRPGGGGVFYFLPANLDRVLCLNNFFLGFFLVFALFVGFIARLLPGFFSRLFTGLLARILLLRIRNKREHRYRS